MQALSIWSPPTGTLGAIVAEAKKRADALDRDRAELERRARSAPMGPSFAGALRQSRVSVIAEVKRRSPSKGWINPGLSAVDQACAYVRGGAAAISVLTEPVHFGGSLEDLAAVRDAVPVPILKKDFHVEPIQLLEAKAAGASAALLIVRALSPDMLRRMTDTAREIVLEVLVEVRDESELERALEAGATIVGINNRNLETLVIDSETAGRMLASVPAPIVAVAESGISGLGDVEQVARAGADAVLVGSLVSAAPDPAAAVRELASVARVPSARGSAERVPRSGRARTDG